MTPCLRLPLAVAWGLAALALTACGPDPWDVGDPGGERDPAALARAAQERAARHFGLPVELRDALGIVYRLVPPSRLTMGSPATEPGRAEDEAPHEVHLSVPYYLQAEEATWAEVARWRPELLARANGEDAGRPAHGLTHAEASAYAAWVADQDPVHFHRLPSESEWEHAARAGSGGPWGAGVVEPGAARNAWGLSSMHGGVAEWCRCWYGPYPQWAADLPTGPPDGTQRCVRGGADGDERRRLRCAARERLPPDASSSRVGLRLLLEAGYAVPGFGPHRLEVRAVEDPHARGAHRPVTGCRLRLVSVPERLTARQENRAIRWVELDGTTPVTLRMLPGRYYFQAWREDEAGAVRGQERKCSIPEDLPVFEVGAPDPPR
jgi:formylglycine-generating enzyme